MSATEQRTPYKIVDIGSTWGKWDLHIHSPNTRLSDEYRSAAGIDPVDTFCEKIEASDVQVIGITDYFSVNNYFAFIKQFR